MRGAIGLAALALLLAPAAARAQQERIRDFASDIRVAHDGELTVTETIRVNAAGDAIRHGIERTFPTSYRNLLGQRTHVGFTVDAVTMDGHAEPWTSSGMVNGVRLRIGEADTLLPPGEHVFTLRYRTTRQVIHARDHDELYWNVTGNGWAFPIDRASARIALPEAVRFGQRAVYTGPQGATAHDAVTTIDDPGVIAFVTTQPLGREEGLTVAAAFPEGVVAAPGAGARAGWWLADWGPLIAGALATLALLWFQLRAWWTVGRGPRAGTVVPLFAPPDGLSAAATRYVSRMGMDDRAFTAAIVELGVKRELRIEQAKGGWLSKGTTTLTRTPGGDETAAPETAMLTKLFQGGDTIELKQANHERLQTARSALGDGLDAAYLGTTFERHRDYAVGGLLAIPAAICAVALVVLLVEPGMESKAPLGGIALAALAYVLWRWRTRATGPMLVVAWLAMAGCVLGLLIATFAAFGTALGAGGWPVLLPLVALPVALLSFKWMAAPTAAGRLVMDRIAGFRQYLGITEEHRLDTMNPPDKTPELFERYLPYAIALGVENRWADRFASVLAAAAAAGQTGTALGWYSGSGDLWSDPGGFASSMGASLTSTVSSAASSPSSGAGGGGSSGGGGGGGGGGGW